MRPLPSLAFLSVILLLTHARAETVAAPAFGSGMVLQRDRVITVWGTDNPGLDVTATLAGQTARAKADKDGKWVLAFPALPAGGPHELAIKGSGEVRFDDVLIGDVWLAAGQSNMAFRLADEAHGGEAAAKADFPQIRFLQVPAKASREPFRPKVAWQATTPATAGHLPAVAFYFARDLYENLKVPVGIINASWGGTRAEPWIPLEALNAHPDFKNLRAEWDKKIEWDAGIVKKNQEEWGAWYRAAGEARKNHTEPPPKPPAIVGPEDSNTPGLLFQSMIAPFVPFELRGVIWYQGESSGWSPGAEYHQLFTLLITEWRKAWNRPDLPFLFVQLPNYEAGNPAGTNWADVRDAQARALKIPHTGMAVAIDVGETMDIHPKNKQDVGLRLALVARARVYGEKVAHEGPALSAITRQGGTLALQFTHTEKGLAVRDGGELAGFEAAGADGKFLPVAAKIEGTDTVILSAPDAIEVRYAWRNDPQPRPNLVNSAALPAPPFRAPVK